MTTHASRPSTLGVILAGGAAKRLGGGDKGSRDIGGRSLIERVVERMTDQCSELIISANGDTSRFSNGLTVVPDSLPDRPGPLAGILAGLDHISSRADREWLVSVPVDCPFLPSDLVEKFHAARNESKIVIARSNGQVHPVIGLWHVSLRADLYHALAGEDIRKAGAFVARHHHVVADWPSGPFDPFFNVNLPDDLREAERIAATASAT